MMADQPVYVPDDENGTNNNDTNIPATDHSKQAKYKRFLTGLE
ncbi:hypothetical protein [Pedobacter panaciterrae]